LHEKRLKLINKIHSGLNRWQRVQLARHPERPYSLDYINLIFSNFFEIHGDRLFADDPAVVTGFGKINNKKVAIIAQQKGRNTKENLYRNFGMMKPEGYRKAMRVMKLAEKFKIPIITFMDTPGAFPGIGAEERGQGEAIANNLIKMSGLKVPVISVVIGEGASGGALGIGVCDKFLMMQNSWYSVISPEGCASILFRDASKAEEAAEALKVTPDDMVAIGICDLVILEPNGGAHRDSESSSKNLESALLNALNDFNSIEPELFLDMRIEKYDKLGFFEERK
jgi:acetyl-CoA carboxylase carboxyl transferase subunit alpha